MQSVPRRTAAIYTGLLIGLAFPLFAACGPPPIGGTGGTGGAPAVLCPTNSGYNGDELCIPPPAPEKGIQLHVGPAIYDAAHIAPFLQQSNTESVACYFGKTPNTETMYYFNEQVRMRPGTHHLIMNVIAQDVPDGWGPCLDLFGAGALGAGGIPGAQTASRDIPDTDQLAPENKGIARILPPKAQVQYQLHYYNFSPNPILREIWVNLYSMDPSEATQPIYTIGLIGGLDLAVPPQSHQTWAYGCNVLSSGRIYDLLGHYHAHTERFSIWRVRNGQQLSVYDSFDWYHPANFTYDSVHQNPVADRQNRIPGGYSGILDVQAGDRFEWECEINNTTSQTLHFANEAQTAEMCITFGSFVPSTKDGAGLACLAERIAPH